MTAEEIAALLLGHLHDDADRLDDVRYSADAYDEPLEDVRTGGSFFEVDCPDGETYTVLVVRTGG
jgi:hypothetical protein